MSIVQLRVPKSSVFLVVTTLSENSGSSLDPGFQEAEAYIGCWWLLQVFLALYCCWGGSQQQILYFLDYVIPLFTQLFLFQSTNGDFAAVPSEVNSEERYICDQMALVTCVLQ